MRHKKMALPLHVAGVESASLCAMARASVNLGGHRDVAELSGLTEGAAQGKGHPDDRGPGIFLPALNGIVDRDQHTLGRERSTGILPNTVAFVQKSTQSPGDFARAFRGKSGTLLLHFRWKHKEISPVSVPRGRSKTVPVLP
jgi:hypothetical protein